MVFFFKQKTAYEIGTGDWSSDVCSSDLNIAIFAGEIETGLISCRPLLDLKKKTYSNINIIITTSFNQSPGHTQLNDVHVDQYFQR